MRWFVLCALVVMACQDKTKKKGDNSSSGPGDPDQPNLLPFGMVEVGDLNYQFGKGRGLFEEAQAAMKKKDWATAQAKAQAAITADPRHKEAEFLLAEALAAQNKEPNKIYSIMRRLYAFDWLKYGPLSLESKHIQAMPVSGKIKVMGEHYQAAVLKKISEGMWVVARRSTYKPLNKDKGEQWDSTRGELFSYNAADGRFIRITHTGETLLGYRKTKDGDIVYLSNKRAAPLPTGVWALARLTIGMLDKETLQEKGKPARLTHAVETAVVKVAPGGELALATYSRDNGTKSYSYDYSEGKLVESPSLNSLPQEAGDLFVDHSTAHWIPEEIPVECTEDGCKTEDGKEFKIPGNLSPSRAWPSPDGKIVVLETVACQEGIFESALYFYRTDKDVSLVHIDRSQKAHHTVRWLDNMSFIFEAGPSKLSIYDINTRAVSSSIKSRYGLALHGLGSEAVPSCDSEYEPDEDLVPRDDD